MRISGLIGKAGGSYGRACARPSVYARTSDAMSLGEVEWITI
jgi:hypothetical protein